LGIISGSGAFNNMIKKVSITWLSKPENQDYAAAMSYLSLLYEKKTTTTFVDQLRNAVIAEFKAKDVFRASGLPLLGLNNSHVLKDKKKILSKAKLSPILLVRDSQNGKVLIADGYHRMCAVYYYDEDAVIPCQIV
jgi:hypothetical protein